jgi:N-acyl homoserine lactone hydrolase
MMARQILAAALAWFGLGALQAPPSAPAVEVELWRLDCGEFDFADFNAFFSDTSEYPPGPKHLVGSCYLIRHADHYMLWDTGIPGGIVGHPLQTPVLRATLSSRIVDQLARIAIRPEQVSVMGISHYHFDHVGQAADFRQARLIMGAGDLEVLRGAAPQVRDMAQALQPWLQGGGTVTEARGDVDVFEDGRVVMLSLPGHTPGHYGLLVRLASGPVLLSGDTWHASEQVARHGVPPFNTNRAESLASMDRLERLARNLNARLIIQHEPADIAKLPAFPEAAR